MERKEWMNKHLSHYLHKRKHHPSSHIPQLDKKKQEVVKVEKQEPTQDSLKTVEPKIEKEIAKAKDSQEEKKSGFWSKLKGIFFTTDDEEKLEDEYAAADSAEVEAGAKQLQVAIPEVEDDLKKALRITVSTMERLDHSEFEQFRQTDDFKEYKKLLEKYQIKKL